MTEVRCDDPHIIHGHDAVYRFVTAGRALFTIRNTETGNRVTYRVVRPKGQDRLEVHALCGPDNTDQGSYRLLGYIEDGEYHYADQESAVYALREAAREDGNDWVLSFTASILDCFANGWELSFGREKALNHNLGKYKIPLSTIAANDMKAKVFEWLWRTRLSTASELPDQVEVWHEGRCARCGRRLTVPESISSGFGPECITKVA